VGIPGKRVLVGKKLPPQTEGKNTGIDLGFVGEVVDLKLDEVEKAISEEKGARHFASGAGQGWHGAKRERRHRGGHNRGRLKGVEDDLPQRRARDHA
jgi:hypothetical protein